MAKKEVCPLCGRPKLSSAPGMLFRINYKQKMDGIPLSIRKKRDEAIEINKKGLSFCVSCKSWFERNLIECFSEKQLAEWHNARERAEAIRRRKAPASITIGEKLELAKVQAIQRQEAREVRQQAEEKRQTELDARNHRFVDFATATTKE